MVTKINSNAVAVKPVSHLCKFFCEKWRYCGQYFSRLLQNTLLGILDGWKSHYAFLFSLYRSLCYIWPTAPRRGSVTLRTRDWLLTHSTVWFLSRIPDFSTWINFMVLETNRNGQDWISFVEFCEISCMNNFLGNRWVVKRTHAVVTSPLTITETNAVKIT